MPKRIRKLPKQLMSKKLLGLILDDFSLFGSVPFYWFITLGMYFIGNMLLFSRLAYSWLIGFIIILIVKNVHYKDRPRKEEFSIFMEKVAASSFPSSHSMGITVLAILISLTYPYGWIIAMLGFVSIMVYIQRYITRKHFVIDIIGGILIAIAITIFVVKVF